MVGILVLAHSQPDYYSPQSRILSQAYANQVAIAIHNAQLYEQARDIAALEERNRLARELHDSVAQALYSISLFTDATRMALETNKLEVVKQHLGELVELSREAMSDMRLLIFELRPPVLEKTGWRLPCKAVWIRLRPGPAFRRSSSRKESSSSLPRRKVSCTGSLKKRSTM